MSQAPPVLAYVGLGANLEDAEAQLAFATRELARLGRLRVSSTYRTEPLGPPGQPWYLNAVAEIETRLAPRPLLAELHAIEARAGRDRARESQRWGPRVLDLDLLLYGREVLGGEGQDPALPRVPHPGLRERRFVLEPLAELAPGARDPQSGASAAELLAALDDPLRVEKLPASARGRPAGAPDRHPTRATTATRATRGRA